MERLGIEMLSVFGMPPIEFVQLVADLDAVTSQPGWLDFRR